MLGGGVADRAEKAGLANVDDEARKFERVLQLVERGRERARGLGAGDREQRSSRGENARPSAGDSCSGRWK